MNYKTTILTMLTMLLTIPATLANSYQVPRYWTLESEGKKLYAKLMDLREISTSYATMEYDLELVNPEIEADAHPEYKMPDDWENGSYSGKITVPSTFIMNMGAISDTPHHARVNIVSIGNRCFKDSKVTEVVLSPQVTNLDYEAFSGSKMKRIVLTPGVEKINWSTFGNCPYLSEIVLEEESEHLKVEDGVLYSADMEELICFPASLDIREFHMPSTVKKIRSWAFMDTQYLETLYVNEGCKLMDTTGNEAGYEFRDCRSIKNIYFPESVDMIYYGFLMHCDNIQKLMFSSPRLRLQKDDLQNCIGGLDISKIALYYPADAPTETVTTSSIGTKAFAYTDEIFDGFGLRIKYMPVGHSWKEGHLSYTTLSVGFETDSGVYSVKGAEGSNPNFSITIPEEVYGGNIRGKVVEIEDNAFLSWNKVPAFTLPATIEKIGENAFLNCTKVDQFEIPATVRSLGKFAFGGNKFTKFISRVSDPYTIEMANEVFGTTDLSKATLYVPGEGISRYQWAPQWSKFGKVETNVKEGETYVDGDIRYEITKIDDGRVYAKVSGLYNNQEERYDIPTHIVIEGTWVTVNEIGDNAFWNAYYAEEVTLSDNITVIGQGAFNGAYSLNYISLGNSVETIKEEAFANCKITEITLPKSVKTIETLAFNRNPLACVTVEAENPADIKLVGNVFKNVTLADCTLYVPRGSKQLYEAAATWKNFGNIVEVGEETETGDANGDGKVNSGDLATVISAMNGFIAQKAEYDVNGDGKINSGDLATIIMIMISK